MQTWTIGQLAQHAGIGIETVRFYERRGLIEEPPRRSSGYRQYQPESLARLRFIRRAKELGFSLDEIGELLALRSHPAENRDQVRARAQAKIADLEQRIADLERMKETLQELAAACAAEKHSADCPILAALDHGNNGVGDEEKG